MDIGLLHKMCKEDTRNAFDEFKRVLSVELFPYNDNVKNDLQMQLVQGMCAKTVKYFIMNNYFKSKPNLSELKCFRSKLFTNFLASVSSISE